MRKVTLTYFKPSGKYYCDGEYESILDLDFEIYEEVRTLRYHKHLPGLSSGTWVGNILVQPEDGVKALID
jgi:hypothetical protein